MIRDRAGYPYSSGFRSNRRIGQPHTRARTRAASPRCSAGGLPAIHTPVLSTQAQGEPVPQPPQRQTFQLLLVRFCASILARMSRFSIRTPAGPSSHTRPVRTASRSESRSYHRLHMHSASANLNRHSQYPTLPPTTTGSIAQMFYSVYSTIRPEACQPHLTPSPPTP